MAAPSTSNTFLDILRKSNVLSEERVGEFLGQVSNPDQLSPADLAGRMVREGYLTPFQANHLLKGRYKNFFIGKYKVLEPLGSGGMSQVFLCEHRDMRHRVALKMLPIKESTDPTAVSRFLREARAAASVNHPNVVRAHDFDQSDGKFYYLIMDYVDGINLHELVKAVGPLPPEMAAQFIAQAAQGLQHIADNGLIHRDLKPSNLLLDRTGVVRILDLGLARFTEDEKDNITRQFQNNTVMGTADYLAPEQALMVDALDVRADIYSLGATFYYLLAGQAPFEELSVTQKLLAHQLRDPDPLPDSVPEDMQDVVRTMMQKLPENRFQTPLDVAEALADWTAVPLPPPDESIFPRRGPGGGPASNGPRTNPPSTSGHGNKTAKTVRTGGTVVGPRPNVGRGSATTVGKGPRSSRLSLPEPESAKSKLPLYAIVGGIVAVAIVGAILAYTNPFGKKPATADAVPGTEKADARAVPPAGSLPPAGSRIVGANGPYTTVLAALDGAPVGTKIYLADAEHAEQLEIESIPANVFIGAWPLTRVVRWVAPPGLPANKPLVRIDNADSLVLSNVAFDGGGKASVLVSLSGACPGTTLDNVTATGYRTAAVQLTGVQGSPGREVRVRKLHATGGAVGVRVAPGADGSPTKHVAVEQSRFEDATNGVEVSGPVEALAVTFCRFHKNEYGLHFPAKEKPPAVSVTVQNNAFAELGRAGLMFDAPAGSASRFTVTNNLFFKTPQAAATAGISGLPSFDLPPWVWYNDEFPPEKETNIPAGTRLFRRVFELAAVPAAATLDIACAASFRLWVNGEFVGESEPKYYTKRVASFPVAKLLKPGKNVIAVEGTNTLDPISPGFAMAAGLTVRLGVPATNKALVATDDAWKSAPAADDGWQKLAFADADWKPVRIWDKPNFRYAWQNSLWDSALETQVPPSGRAKFLVGGNVRDYESGEGYPLLDGLRGIIKELAGMDRADDANFLRSPRNLPKLARAGANGAPVGVPVN